MSEQSEAEIVEQSEELPSGSNAMQLLGDAVSNGADTETLEKLIELKERTDNNEARKSFDASMADLRSDLPTITKDNSVSHKGGNYEYEDLSTIVEKVSPAMAEHDLSFRWRTDSEETNQVKVTCIISHRDGHSEETTLSAKPDTSGSKNSIQAIGSTVTYLQRYTLKAALGIAAGPDDDAQSVNDSGNTQSTSSNSTSDSNEELTYPFGDHQGEPISEVPTESLEWFLEDYMDEEKRQDPEYGDKNCRLESAIEKEYKSRDSDDTGETEENGNDTTPQDYVKKLLANADDIDTDDVMECAEETVSDYDDEMEGWRDVYGYLKNVVNGDDELSITGEGKLDIIPF